jgi:thiol-disulfide isomerase/thioredoxin
MLKRHLILLVLLLLNISVFAQPLRPFEPEWYSKDGQGQLQIHFYFFQSQTCPHCRQAKPFISQLETNYSWLKVHTYEVSTNLDNAKLYNEMAKSLGENSSSVPAFLFCEQMQVGYDDENGIGALLKRQLEACYEKQSNSSPLPNEEKKNVDTVVTGQPLTSPPAKDKTVAPLQIPWLGTVNTEQFSLPVLTLVIAGLDAFNPCAFFVLLFLLSLLVHTRKRSRMLLIGGIFVFFSGLIYFLFMAAWLNIFLWLGELKIITIIAGLIAVVMAIINIKDFFWFKVGVSLTIPEEVKPGLYQRMRKLVTSTELVPMIISTIILAIVVNAYELLCTAGFPMVYTRILTLNELPKLVYYLYLVLYNVVYVIPLFVIVVIFTYTLGSRKLAESEGRALKLMSGLMMLGLGSVLLIKPELLTDMSTSAAVLGAAAGLSVVLVWGEKYYRRTTPSG